MSSLADTVLTLAFIRQIKSDRLHAAMFWPHHVGLPLRRDHAVQLVAGIHSSLQCRSRVYWTCASTLSMFFTYFLARSASIASGFD